MNQRPNNLAAVIMLLGLTTTLNAQNNGVDIGLHEGQNGNLEVRVMPHADFDGVFSSLVFTLRWESATGVTLGEPVQNDAERSYIPINPSGEVQEEGGYTYQVYAGIGMRTISDAAKDWKVDREYVIAEIPIEGHAKVELINDGWTDDLHHNGSYFVSLGDEDRTGSILKSMASGGDPLFDFSIVPNPNQGRFTLTMNMAEANDLLIEVVNLAGLLVYSLHLHDLNGTFRKEIDLTSMSSGVYHLKLVKGSRTLIRKVLIR